MSLRLSGPDDVTRAFIYTLVTSGALRIVDLCHTVIHRNGPRGTIALTQLAGNTPHVTVFARGLAVVHGHTANPVIAVKRNQLDDSLRAGLDADAAALTFGVVNRRNPVHHRNGGKGTRRDTRAKTDAAVRTELVTPADF